jgi:acetyl-CoA carboxylase biotin carboxyl carrier protein
MNYKEIRELIDLISNTDVLEIEVERSGTRVRLRREGSNAARRPEVPRAAPAPTPTPMTDREPEQEEPRTEEGVIRAPLVGTFYRSPGPDAAVFVEAGDQVAKGQTLCIVEAMKLMNEIEAEFAGTVREIYVENGQPVEYGQPLFRIERTG